MDRRREIIKYIDWMVYHLNHPHLFYHYCIRILRKLDDFKISGRTSRGIASGIVLIAGSMCNLNITIEEIARVLKVTPATVRNNSRYIAKALNLKLKPIGKKYSGKYVIEGEI